MMSDGKKYSEFQIYLINEFLSLIKDKNKRLKLEWNPQRTRAKVNYNIHTDAILINIVFLSISQWN
jgi:hypothetical protein